MTLGPFDSKDFSDFHHADPIAPPSRLSEAILNQVHRDLNPSAWSVFAKVSLIHFFVGLATLSFCPQFGLGLLGNKPGLMGFFMSLGPYGCVLACGSFFLGTSVFVACLLLRAEELGKLKRNSLLITSALASLSLGFFIMAGSTEIILGFAIAWLFGSIMAGMAFVELVFSIRATATES